MFFLFCTGRSIIFNNIIDKFYWEEFYWQLVITSWSGIVSELHREVKGAATPAHADILAGNLTHDSRSALALGLPPKVPYSKPYSSGIFIKSLGECEYLIFLFRSFQDHSPRFFAIQSAKCKRQLQADLRLTFHEGIKMSVTSGSRYCVPYFF